MVITTMSLLHIIFREDACFCGFTENAHIVQPHVVLWFFEGSFVGNVKLECVLWSLFEV